VIPGGIVEVHGAFDQMHSRDASVEIQIALRVAGERRYMVQA
jgi:hypothetical protein